MKFPHGVAAHVHKNGSVLCMSYKDDDVQRAVGTFSIYFYVLCLMSFVVTSDIFCIVTIHGRTDAEMIQKI